MYCCTMMSAGRHRPNYYKAFLLPCIRGYIGKQHLPNLIMMSPMKNEPDVETRVVNRNGGRISLHVLLYIVKFRVGQCVCAGCKVGFGMKHAVFYTTCSPSFVLRVRMHRVPWKSDNLLYRILKLLIQLSSTTIAMEL